MTNNTCYTRYKIIFFELELSKSEMTMVGCRWQNFPPENEKIENCTDVTKKKVAPQPMQLFTLMRARFHMTLKKKKSFLFIFICLITKLCCSVILLKHVLEWFYLRKIFLKLIIQFKSLSQTLKAICGISNYYKTMFALHIGNIIIIHG